MLGYPASEMVGRTNPALWHDANEIVRHAKKLSAELGRTIEPGFESFVAKCRMGRVDENEWTFIRKDGTRFPAFLSATELRNLDGQSAGFLGIIALLHEKLYESEDLARVNFADYLNSVFNHLFESFGTKVACISHKVEAHGVALSLDAAIPCGLIVNELASNALKHAFGNRSGGEITLTLTRASSGFYNLHFRDNGVGLPTGLDLDRSTSLGLKLVTMLARQLQGTVETQNADGAHFHITFQDPRDKPLPPMTPPEFSKTENQAVAACDLANRPGRSGIQKRQRTPMLAK